MENTQEDNEAFEHMKEFNIQRRLIKSVYGLIAHELNYKAEV